MAQIKGSAFWTPARIADLRRRWESLSGLSIQQRCRRIAVDIGRAPTAVESAVYYYQISITSSVLHARAERQRRREEDSAALADLIRVEGRGLRM
jgi:hypothetical protein